MRVNPNANHIDLANVDAGGLNGVNDDHPLIQARVNAEGPGAAFVLPWDAVMALSEPLVLLPGQSIVSHDRRGGRIIPLGDSHNLIENTPGEDLALRRIVLDGDKANVPQATATTSNGLFLEGGEHEIEDVRSIGHHGSGIRSTAEAKMHVEGGWYDDNDTRGIFSIDTETTIIGAQARRNQSGFHVLAGTARFVGCVARDNNNHGFTATHTSEGFQWSACEAFDNGGSGFTAGGSVARTTSNQGWSMIGCHAKRNTDNGFAIDPTIAGLDDTVLQLATMASCTAEENGVHGFNMTHVRYLTASSLVAASNANSGIALANSRAIALSVPTAVNNLNRGITLVGTDPNIGDHRIYGACLENNGTDYFDNGNQVLGVTVV